ncbi:FxsA family protein [Blastococcus litoris]|uniref:FxsA family protein n=1 Tax=Blastococcus litoris TaxID=2171622 RepID=UPI000E3084E8|nr:FxsA family protein [Blastococcus litoris]
MSDAVGRRVRTAAGLLVLAELVVFVLVAAWIGVGWTILATLATSVIGWVLLARQGTRALADLRERARSRRSPGAELGNAGLVAAGGLLMVLPGFIGDVVGLLCLLPGTRNLVRGALTRLVLARLPVGLRPPVRVESVRTAEVPLAEDVPPGRPGSSRLVIEGEVVRGPDGRPLA